MNTLKKIIAGVSALALALASAGPALAQSVGVPQVQSVGPNDLFQDVVNGTPQAPTFYASGPLLAGTFAQAAQSDNFLIGGDAGQNLWQRATTGSSVTTTLTYGGPDRFAYWSGTSTAMTVSRDSTAAALPAGSQYDFKMQRTAAQTGVVQTCLEQEVSTQNSFYLAGHTVELDFNVYTGANFSATGLNAYITYGTGTDEGTAKQAYGLNAGGGGGSGWAGQANATAGLVSGLTTSTAYRVASVGAIPATATEVGVEICFTPVGTAGTTDALYLSNIELRKADHLAGFANATNGYSVNTTTGAIAVAATTITNGSTPVIGTPGQNALIPAFSRRQSSLEALLQLQYFWLIAEPAASKAVGNGNYQTATICDVQIPTPVPMFKAPTLTIGGTAEANTTWAVMIASTTPVVLASTYLIQDAVIGNTPNMIAVQATTASKTAANGCTLVGAGGGANIQASSEL